MYCFSIEVDYVRGHLDHGPLRYAAETQVVVDGVRWRGHLDAAVAVLAE